jgi:hypothetical protein
LATRAECLDADNFQAARYQLHHVAWEYMCWELHRMGLHTKPVTAAQRRVLKMLKDGARPQFWDI